MITLITIFVVVPAFIASVTYCAVCLCSHRANQIQYFQ